MGKQEAKKNAFRVSKEPRTHGSAAVATPPPESPRPATVEEHLGTLPRSYSSDSVFLIARDPEMLFTYWDIAWIEHPPIEGRRPHLRLFQNDGSEVYRTAICADNSHWYIPVGQGSCEFYAEVGFFDCQATWEPLARSNIARTPHCQIAPIGDDRFATLPYHLAFQRVVDLVAHAGATGEPLMETLSRVQEENALTGLLETTDRWDDQQRLLVATLLGYNDPAALPTEPEALEQRLREELRTRLSSHAKAVTITTTDSASGLADAALLSLAGSSSLSSELLSSFDLTRGGSSEALASWHAAATGRALAGETASSWGGDSSAGGGASAWGGDSSWSSYAWAVAGLSSEALSSFTLGSETLSSGAFSSSLAGGSSEGMTSWGAHGSAFFSRVQVESTIRGQATPGSRVWVGGREVVVGPDGAFTCQHLHRGEEVAIVVISPDGREHHLSRLRHGH